jgi:hypothetical protein
MTATLTPLQFEADAMLMYGWVADEHQRVTQISRSLRRWIEKYQRTVLQLRDLLDRVEKGISVAELHQAILHEVRERDTPALIEECLNELSRTVANAQQKLRLDENAVRGDYTIRRLFRVGTATDETPLAGVRFIREGATLLASEVNVDRVDMVAVAIIRKIDGRWRAAGFQGQLQEASLRATAKLHDGLHAAGIALMARNLSHNIGSHALFWLRSDAAHAGNSDRAKFYDYLQARMELLAGFATHMPLSETNTSVLELVQSFGGCTLLTQNIARSESVATICIKPDIAGDCEIGLPGGEVGAHAFYSILENCIRDSSKYARRPTPDSLTMRVRARVCTGNDEFIEVDVSDDTKNYDAPHADGGRVGDVLARKVDALRLVDDGGTLLPHEWGVKERYVCARLLRGERPEDTLPPEEIVVSRIRPARGAGELPILQVLNIDGCITWRFYLNRPGADTLLVSDDLAVGIAYRGRRDVVVRSVTQVKKNLNNAKFVRTRFIVLGDVPDVPRERLRAALPSRIFVCGPPDAAEGLRAQIMHNHNDVSAATLQRLIVEALLMRHRTELPALVFATAVDDVESNIPGIEIDRIREENKILDSLQADGRRRALFQRHSIDTRQADGPALTVEALESKGIVFYEQNYTESAATGALIRELERGSVFAAYRFLEAVLTSVIVADERLDLSLSPNEQRVLKYRGIEITGRAFSSGQANSFDRATVSAAVENLIATAVTKDFVVLHLGIVDKIVKELRVWTAARLASAIEARGARLVIHSGRMDTSTMPKGVKFLSLTNVIRWITCSVPKFQIIDELHALRRL